MKVYIWYPTLSGKQVGHDSLTLDDGTHTSWWPTDKTNGKNSKKDIELEGREPDKTYAVNGLDEDKIKTWWKWFLDSGVKYNLMTQNCCDIVIMSLRVGQIRRKFTIWKFIKSIIYPRARFTGIILDMINNPGTVVDLLFSSECVSDVM